MAVPPIEDSPNSSIFSNSIQQDKYVSTDEVDGVVAKLAECTCAVCLGQVADPRMLPCLHSFCLACIKGLLSKAQQQGAPPAFCPLCRREIIAPPPGIIDGFC